MCRLINIRVEVAGKAVAEATAIKDLLVTNKETCNCLQCKLYGFIRRIYLNSLNFRYMAMYPYKPQKADELELKKGILYTVTEKCQDGWFRGTSQVTHKSGVFPGNYVALPK